MVSPVARLFPYEKWTAELPSLARRYRDNQPCPHIYLTDFLEPRVALTMAGEFPALNTDAWTHYKHHNENKLGLSKRSMFPPTLGEAVDEFKLPGVCRLALATGRHSEPPRRSHA